MSMPSEIELPRASDFCRGEYRNGRGQCCFLGWKRKLFPDLDQREDNEFYKIANDEANAMKLHTGNATIFSIVGPATFNDDAKNSTRRLATWFERVVKRFGYDIS